MNINFPPVDEQYIKGKIDAGFYSNATELVRDAVRRLREADEKRQDLLAAVQLGEEQIAQGHYKHYTPELFETIKQNSIEKAQRNQPLNPDVLP